MDHPPKGGSPSGHMVSAHRLAHSHLFPALQDLDLKRQHQAADGARDKEPGRRGVPQFPCLLSGTINGAYLPELNEDSGV